MPARTARRILQFGKVGAGLSRTFCGIIPHVVRRFASLFEASCLTRPRRCANAGPRAVACASNEDRRCRTPELGAERMGGLARAFPAIARQGASMGTANSGQKRQRNQRTQRMASPAAAARQRRPANDALAIHFVSAPTATARPCSTETVEPEQRFCPTPSEKLFE